MTGGQFRQSDAPQPRLEMQGDELLVAPSGLASHRDGAEPVFEILAHSHALIKIHAPAPLDFTEGLIVDLGGEDAISTQERALVDLTVRTKLLLDSIDGWLLKQSTLVNVRKRALIPVVRERTQLADAVARYLAALGLKRRTKSVMPLHEYLAQRAPTTDRS